VERFRCPGCFGDMEFDPVSGGLKCRFCGHAETLPPPATTTMASHAFEQALAEVDKALEVTCQECGSVVNFEPPEVAGACLFCGAAIVAQVKTGRSADRAGWVVAGEGSQEHRAGGGAALAGDAVVRSRFFRAPRQAGWNRRDLSSVFFRRGYGKSLRGRARGALMGYRGLHRNRRCRPQFSRRADCGDEGSEGSAVECAGALGFGIALSL